MPRPTGKAERELNENIAALKTRLQREGRLRLDPTVTVSRREPQPRMDKRKVKPTPYPGWTPREKPCRYEGCENVYVPAAPSQAYCSRECAKAAERVQRRITDKGKRQRRKAREVAARQPLLRRCKLPGCGNEFEPRASRQEYCSEEHADEGATLAKRHRRALARGEAPPPMPTSATLEAVEEIEQLTELTPRAYVVWLWKRVNEDPHCPEVVYRRLEAAIGLRPDLDPSPEPGSTMPAVDEREPSHPA